MQHITTPYIREICEKIKVIQNRMKQPDLVAAPYIHVYDALTKEFTEFSDSYTTIFTKVIRGENLRQVCAILLYRDKVERGLISEEEVSEMLARHFLSPELKQQSDANMVNVKK